MKRKVVASGSTVILGLLCLLLADLASTRGLGPVGAIGIASAMLSVLTPDDVRAALTTGDVTTLMKIPGVGRKSAERLVLELKDKVGMPSAPGGGGLVAELLGLDPGAAHRVRVVWATHQAHHSSEYFNFATALRQKWNNSGEIIMWLPLPLLGIPPWMVFVGFSVNRTTLPADVESTPKSIRTLPRPVEFVFNTPSHHRVHHGCDPEYLDRNYAGMFIIWDRMFGTFQPETHRPTYGLTKPVGTYKIWELQTHEYKAIARDWRSATALRDKMGYVFGPPGWTPAHGREDSETVSSARA